MVGEEEPRLGELPVTDTMVVATTAAAALLVATEAVTVARALVLVERFSVELLYRFSDDIRHVVSSDSRISASAKKF